MPGECTGESGGGIQPVNGTYSRARQIVPPWTVTAQFALDTEHFFLYHTVALYPVVVFKYRGKAEVRGIQYTRGLLGTFDGSLPQNLHVRGRALLDLMEQWRLRRAQAAVTP
jgi:hypothetical protein